ncbi:tyrosine-type recombinase/integrase [Roseomonas mucosa]|uniref:tyrosine-type recombinase/integrase n=1 Tax=Roseomonas mucosa TaxID=207340 RepID=UPI0028CED700|nr:tyrosine-type recombinase/integrase [Roseomonas mucosa]MDT8351883.1 tyrosine-type recombinase/integrase [Roseomonas mucosa]
MHLSARPPAPGTPLEQASGLSAGAPLTVAMALAEVARWDDLTPTRRRDLASALRGVCRLAGMDPRSQAAEAELTPAFLRERVFDRSATHHGLSRGAMTTLRSNLRAALERLEIIDPLEGPLSPAWVAAMARLGQFQRYGLIAFARFCTRQDVAPEAVDEAVLAGFEAWLVTRSLNPKPRKAVSDVRGGWNRACRDVADWPGRPLGRLVRSNAYVLPLTAFPASFRADLEAFGRRLGRSALDALAPGQRDTAPLNGRPLRPSTVALRVDHARWAASALVASGAVAAAEIASLRDLVVPLKRAQAAIRFLYERAGDATARGRPSAAGHHVAEVLRIVARHYVELPSPQVKQIQAWQKPVALSYRGMTGRNQRCMEAVMQPAIQERLKALPAALMQAARELRDGAPAQARSLAMRAVAVGILSCLPLRLANLAGLRLDRHFHRPDPRRGAITQLSIPPEESKNGRAIDMPIVPEVAVLIREWIAGYRPSAPGCPWLFPGYGKPGERIGHQGLRDAIKASIAAGAGVTMTPHQFRHLAAHRFLEAYPGHYEEVRQLLGHASIATTARAYCGTEQAAAARRYQDLALGRHRGAGTRAASRKTRRG